MQEMFGMERNKKLLIIVLVTSIVIIILGIYMVFFNTTKFALLGVIDNINNAGLEIVEKNTKILAEYDNDYVSNSKVKYYIERDSQREFSQTIIDEVTGEEKVITNIEPYQQILENDLNLYVNKNNKNTHDILKLMLNQEEKTYNIYQKNGDVFLDDTKNGAFIKLNNKEIPFITANSETINQMRVMYERVYKSFKKQLDLANLYKITTQFENETINKYGISMDEKTLLEISTNILNELKKDSKFIDAYILYSKSKNVSSNLNKEQVIQIISSWIEDINKKEVIQGIQYEFIITTSGIFNQNILQIEYIKLLNDTVLEKIDISIDNEFVSVKVEKNSTLILSSDIVLTQNGFDARINYKNMSINVKGNDFDITKQLYITGNIDDKKIDGTYILKWDKEKREVLNDLELKIDNNEKNSVNIDFESTTKFKNEIEYVNTKTIYDASKINQESQEYLNQFKKDVINRLGIEL